MLDLHCQEILSQYDQNLGKYKKIEQIVKDTLLGFVKAKGVIVNSVETRIKTRKSLQGKLELKGNKYQSIYDITDIVGARIVTFYTDEVDKFAAIAEQTFDVDRENSIDKRKMYSVNQFGYLSLHYICRIPKELYFDENMPEINEIRFELQMKTTLQHAWATIFHDTGYKSDIEVPKEYLRRMNRLAGILELADVEFTSIRVSLENYRRSIKQIINSGKLSDVEINKDSIVEYLNSHSFDQLNNRIASINNMEIEQIPMTRPLLVVCSFFRFSNLGDIEKLKADFSEDAYQLCLRQFEGTDLDIISSLTGLQSLSFCYILKTGFGQDAITLFLNELYGERRSNSRIAKKIYEIGVKMGLTPKNKDA